MDIGIIGTAGRGLDIKRLTNELYVRMLARMILALNDVPLTERHLRSGGAAWADHVAVDLFLAGHAASLALYLPCRWNGLKLQFEDTGERDWRTNPGGTANHYHQQFSLKCQRPPWSYSLSQIQQAIAKGAAVHVLPGFHARNVPVAQVHRLYAFTFGASGPPTDSGTAHTWGLAPRTAEKHHIALETL